MKTQHMLPVFCALAVFTGFAMAQAPAPLPLNASELASTIVGKKVEHIRLSDKRIFI
ncbi:hypothetical protein H0A66_03270 [Alcaligenaceae bacterium]|nr:hypothetical protein [Alcaligenaceae bacterium]